jgi:protocatechuate 3,4-dioxygenase beta subunit
MDTERNNPEAITRRRLLRRAGALGIAAAAGGALGLPVVDDAEAASFGAKLTLTPEQEEGPFYVALEKIRKDVRLGRPGVPLHLAVKLTDTGGKPVPHAALDIWQADAVGAYSDEASLGTTGATWLRGVQLTNAKGAAEFATVYPGHYRGRTAHIHIKVHVGGRASGRAYTGGHVSHTGQLMFPDAVSTQVYALAPYTSNRTARTYNSQDRVYTEQGGSRVLLRPTRLGARLSDGLRAVITLVVDPKATPAAVG